VGYGLWVMGGMGYGADFSANRVGSSRNLWVPTGYGFSQVWVMTGFTVFQKDVMTFRGSLKVQRHRRRTERRR
jgi:hypothetical protein